MNSYCIIPEEKKTCESVKRLHFNGNYIEDWAEVEKLGKIFPNLETLIIMENPLSNIKRKDGQNSYTRLKSLSLTKTNLNSWEDIDNLKKFLILDEVKLFDIPLLMDYDKEEFRRLLVARLPTINVLNGTPVSEEERENAERHFIRKYLGSQKQPMRYFELVTKHGVLAPLANVHMNAVAKRATVLMHITGHTPRLEKICLEKTTSRFKKDLSSRLNIPTSQISLYYQDKASNQGTERMIYSQRPLYRYGIKEGDDIFVDIDTNRV